MARFLRHCPGLSKQTIGDLLGENDQFFLDVLDAFTATFQFRGELYKGKRHLTPFGTISAAGDPYTVAVIDIQILCFQTCCVMASGKPVDADLFEALLGACAG